MLPLVGERRPASDDRGDFQAVNSIANRRELALDHIKTCKSDLQKLSDMRTKSVFSPCLILLFLRILQLFYEN